MKASTIVKAIEAVNALKGMGHEIEAKEEYIGYYPERGYFNIPYCEILNVKEDGLVIEFICKNFTAQFWKQVNNWHITNFYTPEMP